MPSIPSIDLSELAVVVVGPGVTASRVLRLSDEDMSFATTNPTGIAHFSAVNTWAAQAYTDVNNYPQADEWTILVVDHTDPDVDLGTLTYRGAATAPPPPPAPSRVTGVRVSPLDGGLRVSWSAAAGEVSQYRVDAADASGKLVRRVYTDADVFEALVDRLANGVQYRVTVTALTSHPDVEGPASETTMATPRGGGDTVEPPTSDTPVPPPPPSRVTGVHVSPLDGGLRVSWSAAAGEVSQYRVDAVDASGELARRVYTDADVFEALVDGLDNGVEYTVTVTALVSDGEDGAPSEPRTATPAALAPSQVAGVRVSPLDGGLRVSWDAAAGEVSQYRVDAADASGELARRVYTDADVHEALLDRLVNGVEYTVTVTALTGRPDVEGPASEPLTMTPQAGAGDTGGSPGPVPALPLTGAGVLAGLLAAAGAGRSRGRRAAGYRSAPRLSRLASSAYAPAVPAGSCRQSPRPT